MTVRPLITATVLRRALSLLRWAGIVGLIGWLAVTWGWGALRSHAGEPTQRLDDAWHEGHQVVDRSGRLLRELPSTDGRRGRDLPLGELGERLAMTTIVSEDRAFYDHDGVDREALARAMKQNIAHVRMVSGASTITQQLVKMLDGGGKPQARTPARKVEEMARAQNLEQQMTKDEILAAYLNRLPYGHGLVGAEAAAQGYFGVAAKDLSWAQCAFLAVLPRAPSYLDPYDHPDRVRLRQADLLESLHETGHLSELELKRALAEPLDPRPLSHPFHAPHLIETLRLRGELSRGAVTQTTVDLELQRDAEGMVRTHLAALERGGADDAAVLVVDNASGEVLAYVGSADFHDPAIAGQVDMVRAKRQPGSTLKPFVYALAFANGKSGASMLADVPTRFGEAGGEYDPQNFHRGFEGPISAREALAGSLNVPAVRLTAELGVPKLLAFLRELGLKSLDKEATHYGVALSLGSGEVTLFELTRAYVTLARGGDHIDLSVTVDDSAQPIGRRSGEQVLDPPVAAAVSEALSDPLARVRLLHGRSPFDIGFPLAVKTGTSSGYRDTWAVGYTAERTVAVWLGNADGAPTNSLTGASGAGPLFADVMRRAMRDVSTREPLWSADDLVTVETCPLSGHPVGPACPEPVKRHFVPGSVPQVPCQVHTHARHRRAELGEAPFSCAHNGPETIAVLPKEFSEWLESQPLGAPGRDAYGTAWFASGTVAGCSDESGGPPGVLAISSPSDGTVLISQDGVALVALRALFEGGDAKTRRAAAEVEFLVDGRVVDSSEWPYEAQVELSTGDHEIVARPKDRGLGVRARPVRVSVR
jgi:penicillin-binding protein 1C